MAVEFLGSSNLTISKQVDGFWQVATSNFRSDFQLSHNRPLSRRQKISSASRSYLNYLSWYNSRILLSPLLREFLLPRIRYEISSFNLHLVKDKVKKKTSELALK